MAQSIFVHLAQEFLSDEMSLDFGHGPDYDLTV